MKTKKTRVFLGTIVLTIALGLSLLAAPPVRAITCADLLGGLDVIVGDKTFENWRNYVSIGTNGALAVSPNLIDISFSINASGEFEVDYQSEAWVAGANQTQATWFTYDVRVLTGDPTLEDNGLHLLNYVLGGNANMGSASITETVTDAAGNPLGEKEVLDDHGNIIVLDDHISWLPPVSMITVETRMDLIGDNAQTGLARIREFSQTFSQTQTTPVPEPCTMLLLGSGLVGVAGLRRRFKG